MEKELSRRRIAIEVPIKLHKKIQDRCKPNGLSMTQWVLQLILKELEK